MTVPRHLISLVVLLGACSGAVTNDRVIPVDGNRVPAAQLRRSVASLCDAVRFVRLDDLANAKAVFQDRAHNDLHTLADALEGRDRETTSLLLQSKNRVESDFSAADLEALKADFPDLIEAAEAGLRVLQIDPLPCALSS